MDSLPLDGDEKVSPERRAALAIKRGCIVCSGYHNETAQTGWLMINLFSPGSRGWKSKMKVPADLASPEASLPGLQMTTFSLCTHMAFPLYENPWHLFLFS